jgi:hypothetical protein
VVTVSLLLNIKYTYILPFIHDIVVSVMVYLPAGKVQIHLRKCSVGTLILLVKNFDLQNLNSGYACYHLVQNLSAIAKHKD